MAIEKLTIKAFLQLAKLHPVLDVRSPGEFKQAHIPGAYNLPLFNDEERKIVGTAYQQQDRETAIKIGLDYFGLKMRKMVEEVESFHKKIILVHCWRGGMRSEGVSWLLELYGFQVFSLSGGYKSFRRFVLEMFSQPFQFKILGGFTGSGKTGTLKELEKQGESIIDLEDLAMHKGSAFGEISRNPQPSQEMFENKLAMKLLEKMNADSIWLEDESRRIGSLNIPQMIWNLMQQAPVLFLDIPFEERLNRILEEYGSAEKENLINAILRIQRRLGGLEAKTAINLIGEGNLRDSFLLLLKYYDRCYSKSLTSREKLMHSLNKLECSAVDIQVNTKKILKSNVQKPGSIIV
jgi:tRNA 2-selenouridine synthase